MLLWKEFGRMDGAVVVLVHGGGLSWWEYEGVIAQLAPTYRVATPVLEGHGENAATPFESIEASAQALVADIATRYGGQVLALGGVSLGGQIVAEALSQSASLARFALLESALVLPIAGMGAWVKPMVSMSFPLMRQRWFARWQASAMGLPPERFETYLSETRAMSRETLLHMLQSNAAYRINPALSRATAKVLIVAGAREPGVVRRSAQALHAALPGSVLWLAPGLRHGEFSLRHGQQYAKRLLQHLHA